MDNEKIQEQIIERRIELIEVKAEVSMIVQTLNAIKNDLDQMKKYGWILVLAAILGEKSIPLITEILKNAVQ